MGQKIHFTKSTDICASLYFTSFNFAVYPAAFNAVISRTALERHRPEMPGQRVFSPTSAIFYLMSITRGSLAQSSEPEAHDKVIIQIELEFGNVGF